MIRKSAALLAVFALILTFAGCAGQKSQSQKIGYTLKEYSIELPSNSFVYGVFGDILAVRNDNVPALEFYPIKGGLPLRSIPFSPADMISDIFELEGNIYYLLDEIISEYDLVPKRLSINCISLKDISSSEIFTVKSYEYNFGTVLDDSFSTMTTYQGNLLMFYGPERQLQLLDPNSGELVKNLYTLAENKKVHYSQIQSSGDRLGFVTSSDGWDTTDIILINDKGQELSTPSTKDRFQSLILTEDGYYCAEVTDSSHFDNKMNIVKFNYSGNKLNETSNTEYCNLVPGEGKYFFGYNGSTVESERAFYLFHESEKGLLKEKIFDDVLSTFPMEKNQYFLYNGTTKKCYILTIS